MPRSRSSWRSRNQLDRWRSGYGPGSSRRPAREWRAVVYWLGGRPALDFVNTRRELVPQRRVPQWPSATWAEWLVAAKVLHAPRAASRGTPTTRELREAIDAGVTAVVAGEPIHDAARLTTIGRLPDRARSWCRSRRLARAASHQAPRLGVRVGMVALDAARMFGTDEVRASAPHLRVGDMFARFYDRSQGARRRWCSRCVRQRGEGPPVPPATDRQGNANDVQSGLEGVVAFAERDLPSPTARAARCAIAASTSRSSSATRCRSSRSGACSSTRARAACRAAERPRRSARRLAPSTSRPLRDARPA